MSRLLLLTLCSVMLLVPACSKKTEAALVPAAAEKSACVFGLVFLGADADQNAAAREHLTTARAGLNAKLCTVTVEGDAPDLAAAFGIEQRPVAVINGRPAAIDSTLAETCRQAQDRMSAGTHLTLEIVPSDTGRLEVTYSVCCDEGTSLENGSVVILGAVRSFGQGALYAGSMHRETEYTVGAGSCHRPGNAALTVPEGTAPEVLKIFGLVLDAEGNVTATACAGGGCGEGGCGGGGCGGDGKAQAGGCGEKKPCGGPCKE